MYREGDMHIRKGRLHISTVAKQEERIKKVVGEEVSVEWNFFIWGGLVS
jgi:hypothetical protein